MLNANRFSADMSVFDNKESAWDFTLKPFHDHAYITIRFAKNVPGTINSFSDIQNAFCFCHLRKCFIIFLANSVDPDQTAHRVHTDGSQYLHESNNVSRQLKQMAFLDEFLQDI